MEGNDFLEPKIRRITQMEKPSGMKGRSLEYINNDVVFREGSRGRKVYLILGGRAEVSRCIAGRKEILAILRERDFFGEMAALRDDMRTMTVTAIGELELSSHTM